MRGSIRREKIAERLGLPDTDDVWSRPLTMETLAILDMASRSLELLVESESFGAVPDGYRAPVADGPAGVDVVRLVCHKCLGEQT